MFGSPSLPMNFGALTTTARANALRRPMQTGGPGPMSPAMGGTGGIMPPHMQTGGPGQMNPGWAQGPGGWMQTGGPGQMSPGLPPKQLPPSPDYGNLPPGMMPSHGGPIPRPGPGAPPIPPGMMPSHGGPIPRPGGQFPPMRTGGPLPPMQAGVGGQFERPFSGGGRGPRY